MNRGSRTPCLDDVYLSSTAYRLGAKKPLSDLDDPLVQDNLAALQQGGFRYCRVADGPASRLAAASSVDSLASAGHPHVDLVVHATDTPSAEPTPSRDALAILRAVSLPTTSPVLVGGSGCGNFAAALRTARNALRAERLSTVLLVTSDCVVGGTRFETAGGIVMSDGAASCLVTAAPIGPSFRVLGIGTHSQALEPSASPLLGVRALKAGINLARARLEDELPDARRGFRFLLTGNYAESTRKIFSAICGFDLTDTYAPRVAEIGHCFSADLMIGLDGLAREGALAEGDRLLLLATSPHTWALVAVEYLEGHPSL
ncbi:3-oxoacyl-[acyl-carrier-protein] synthase-3 [Streptomyces sp. 846.5]|nr:hypothetical protein [Streptomyces sp. 846.5]TDU04453.1 3-oxoacyl-[acyl-carrier-protein] synthase-3 [Streptomyces sp. 846.5]